MSNASSSSSINFALLNQTINRYFPIPLLLFGIIGNILNILIYTRKIFRNNICVNYFLAATSFDSLILMVGLLPRLVSGFGFDPSQSSAVLCKLKFFMVYFTEYTGAWFISLACIERYLSSSTNVHKRELITMKRAYFSMVFVILMGFVIFGEVFYCIDINQQLLGAPNSCYQLKQNIACQIVDSLMQLVFQTVTPAVMMIVFGFLVLKNIRQKRRRIDPVQATNSFMPAVELQMTTHLSKQQQPTNIGIVPTKQLVSTEVNRTAQKRDAQIIQMLLVQVSKREKNK
jgi:hypothetical protein